MRTISRGDLTVNGRLVCRSGVPISMLLCLRNTRPYVYQPLRLYQQSTRKRSVSKHNQAAGLGVHSALNSVVLKWSLSGTYCLHTGTKQYSYAE